MLYPSRVIRVPELLPKFATRIALSVVNLIPALILGPIGVGLLLTRVRSDCVRGWIIGGSVLLTVSATVAVTAMGGAGAVAAAPFDRHWARLLMLVIEFAMAVYIVRIGWRQRQPWVVGLMVAQAAVMAWVEFGGASVLEGPSPLWVDPLSLILALINAVVGGGICLYAVGYMREYHAKAHADVPDRRPRFFGLLFVFIGAMFGLVFANSLAWLFFFWELTTLCSYLLIGYTDTIEARRNALRALAMNLAGGVAFALAIGVAAHETGTTELQALLRQAPAAVLLPAALLCFAGITKSAQLPFCSWLLGAMVAPTPVSALLHSSTMVKAGVYLILRMAPIVAGTTTGLMVALVGALTFLVGSLAAITTSDAKKVLAYSTVANLGLIVLCGGIGTYAAVWAGVLLIVFHAIAKCLLFLCVGLVEHRLHSRDIEAMSGLILHLPRLAIMMLIGMAGMFLAPFGMLISKWAVLKAVVDTYPALAVFVCFGSAATLFFWVKWMGKLLEVVTPRTRLAAEFAPGEAVALYSLSCATFLTCLLFPLISSWAIEPYVRSVFGQSASMAPGNVVIMMIMMVMIMLFPLSFLNYGRGVKVMDAYLGGANVHSSVRFLGAGREVQTVVLHNYYLRDVFDERWLTRMGVVAAVFALLALLVAPLPSRAFALGPPAEVTVTAATVPPSPP